MRVTATTTQQTTSESGSSSRKRRTSPRLPGMRRNARRVPTAQRVRTFYRLFHKLIRWTRPLLAGAVLFLVARYGWMLFSQSTMFALQKVEYPANQPVSKDTLMQFARLTYGNNLLALDLKALTRRMAQHPQIKSVQLRRVLPHTLSIAIQTHRPVAIAMMGQPYLLNKMGRPFAKSEQPSPDMLTISGVRRLDYEQRPKATQRLFRQALALADQYKQRRLNQYQPLQEIQYDPILGYILRTPSGQIFLGSHHFPDRMKQLERLYKLFWQRGVRKLRYVYLNHRRHPNRAIVRLGDAVLVKPAPIPTPPKARKPALH